MQDAFNSGGAQQAGRVHGKNLTFASDLDYVRGIHSWRGGVQIYARLVSRQSEQQLSRHLHVQQPRRLRGRHAAALHAQRRRSAAQLLPRAHRRVLPGRHPRQEGADAEPGPPVQLPDRACDDPRRFEPRLGITWAPTKSGNTTLRASGGIFHGWLDPGIWWQTVRSDGEHQRDDHHHQSVVSGPRPRRRHRRRRTRTCSASYKLNKNVRYSAGIDQRFSPRASVNVLYNYYHQDQLPRGTNLNPLVNGVRPDPAFGNIISTVTDAEIIRHELYVNFNLNLLDAVPGGQPRDVQLAAARRSTAATRTSARGGMRWARSTCRRAARSTRSGATARPTTPTASTSAITSTQMKNLSVNSVDQRVRRVSLQPDDRIRRQPATVCSTTVRPASGSGRCATHAGLVAEHAGHLQPPDSPRGERPRAGAAALPGERLRQQSTT